MVIHMYRCRINVKQTSRWLLHITKKIKNSNYY